MDNNEIQNMELWVKYFLSRIGKRITVEANLRITKDEDGDEVRNCEPVKGLEYRFDNFYIKGYQYHNIYCIKIEFIKSGYSVGEDGKVRSYNEDIWKPYFFELYNSLDDLIRNEKAGEEFLGKYKMRIPWKEFADPYTDQETKKYMPELGITLVAKQRIYWKTIDLWENIFTYKIYDGQECVCDTEKNVFFDGEWKTKLINYIEEKERKRWKAWEAENARETQANFDQAYSRMKSLKNRSNNNNTPNYPQY